MSVRRQAWRSGWRPLVALGLGYLLVLQALFSGLAVVGHATVVGDGSLATVICTPDGMRPAADPVQGPGRSHDPGCCLIGCSGAGSGTAPLPASATLPVVVGLYLQPAFVPADFIEGGHRHSPLSPRAPPRTA